MKKLSIIVLFVSSYLMTFGQNQPQPIDMNNLQNQVTALKNSDFKQNKRLRQFIITSTSNLDSLQAGLNDFNRELTTLSGSVATSKMQVAMLKANSEKLTNDIKAIKMSNAIQYICLILILILLAAIFYQVTNKTRKIKEQNENNLAKMKESLESDLNKTRKELTADISSLKDNVQGKMDDMNKKFAGVNK